MTIQELRDKRVAAIDSAQKLNKAADAESRDLSAEESEQFDNLMAEAESLQAKIDRATKLEVATASLDAPGKRRVPQQSMADGMPDVRVGKDRAEDDPRKGFKSPREFLVAVMNADMPGRRSAADPRLRYLAAVGSDEQSGFADPYGGYLLPEAFSPNLLQIGAEAAPMTTTSIPMTAPVVNIPARTDKNHNTSVTGGLRVYRRAEADTASESRMQIERVKLEAHGLFGIAYATEEILVDSPISFVALLQAGFRDEFTSTLIDERLNGTGVGEFMGIMNSPCLITANAENNQVADTITWNNIVAMRKRCWGYGNSIWLYNHDTLDQLMGLAQIIGTAGYPMWQTSGTVDRPDMLCGRPAYPTEYCKTVGDAGDIVLGNWSQYLEGTYQPLQSGESIHVRFIYNERTFKFTMRNDGAPWWRSDLTPKNSTVTLSPFVVLAART